jgi:apolipoprotein N-acyltransferase
MGKPVGRRLSSIASIEESAHLAFNAHDFLPWSSPRWLHGAFWVVLSALFGGLGNALEPVSMAAWLQPLALILGVSAFDLSSWNNCCLLIIYISVLQGLGVCLGFSSMFGYPSSTPGTVMTTCGLGILMWLIYACLAVLPHYYFQSRYLDSKLAPFVYPVCHTVVSIVLFGNVSSTFTSIGNSVLDLYPLRHIAALVGLAGVEFYVVLSATVTAMCITKHTSIKGPYKPRFILFSIALFLITGFLMQEGTLYQKNVSSQIQPLVPASCVFAQTAKRNTTEWNDVWNNTARRVEALDAFVLWAEEAVEVTDDADEDSLIAQAQELAVTTGRSYLGLAYYKKKHNANTATNHFTLITPQGDVAWNYRKAHPVPGVEDEVVPGPNHLPTHDSPYGKLGGAICFDLDFPNFIRQAGSKRVDIFLQPSWTWNALSSRHFDGDALRAVENGFTLIRCSSDGESGVVSPSGVFTTRMFTGHDPSVEVAFTFPKSSRRTTMYTEVGFVFEWILLAPMCFFLVAVMLPEDYVKEKFALRGRYDQPPLTNSLMV